MLSTRAHFQHIHTEEVDTLCEHTEESQSPLDIGQFQDRQDQEEALSNQEGSVLESISGTQAPHTQCAGSATHLPCALDASDDTQVHS